MMSSANVSIFGKFKFLLLDRVNSLTTLKEEGFWKHFWEKEKMLVTSIFSFSQNVFYTSQNKFQFLSHIYMYFVICKHFEFGPV